MDLVTRTLSFYAFVVVQMFSWFRKNSNQFNFDFSLSNTSQCHHVNVNVRLVDRSLQGLFTVNRLNGIGPNACEGAHGCRHTIHV